MSPTPISTRTSTLATAARQAMEPQPKPPRRESVSTRLVRDTCPLTNAALNLPPYLAVESFGRLGEEGYEFIDELATHAAGGRDGGSTALKGVFKERLLQVISVATQVAIPRRAQRYKLALRGRQEAEGNPRSTSHASTAMLWGHSVDER